MLKGGFAAAKNLRASAPPREQNPLRVFASSREPIFFLLRPLAKTVDGVPPYCIDDADVDAVQAAIGEAVGGMGLTSSADGRAL